MVDHSFCRFQLEYDTLEYVEIERMAQVGHEKLKDDGFNLPDWLQSLNSFWGRLCALFLFGYIVLVCSVCDTPMILASIHRLSICSTIKLRHGCKVED
ncbi:THO complex subunit 2-like [Rhododendron vialii]|uniref:THO complex subunit 2-like n=1 Tax=Rhododendron vialii TaxID=182163 RepID=UPI00265F259D|nr:THO complex subunit 2-like [Rhododendron vialii]